jgi:mono/diheme cytochrome c family protein
LPDAKSCVEYADCGVPSAPRIEAGDGTEGAKNMKNIRIAFAFTSLIAVAAGPARADKVERLWQSKCASCHGDKGKADTKKGAEMKVPDMTTAAFQKEWTDDKLRKATEDGYNETKDGVKKEMDGYKDKLKPEQIDELVKYMRSLAAK